MENVIFNQKLCNITRRGKPRGNINPTMVERIKIPCNTSMQQLLEKLKVTYSKISIFKLLQLLADHRYDLLNALKKTKVGIHILVIKFMELITNLDTDLVCNMLYFRDNELPSEYVIEII